MQLGKCQNKVHPARIIGIVPKGWDHWSRVMGNSVQFLRKDASYVPEVRSPTVRRRELGALLRTLRNENGLTVEQVATGRQVERLPFGSETGRYTFTR
jgi:hypothetical protein